MGCGSRKLSGWSEAELSYLEMEKDGREQGGEREREKSFIHTLTPFTRAMDAYLCLWSVLSLGLKVETKIIVISL